MSTTPRNLPRFLPTLTEIVHPPGMGRVPVTATPDVEDVVKSVMQRVDLMMNRRLNDEANVMIRTLVNEQIQALSVSLRQEVATVVRQAVSEAMASRTEVHKSK